MARAVVARTPLKAVHVAAEAQAGQRLRDRLFATISVLLFLWGLSWNFVVAAGYYSLNYNDFGRFYYSARNWRDGGSLYGPTFATWFQLDHAHGMHFWNLNPPHFSLLLLPLSVLDLESANQVWFWANFLAFACAAHLTVTTLQVRLRPSHSWLLAAAILGSAPTLAVVATGQFIGPLTLLVTWTWRHVRRGDWSTAAVGIGVAWSLKIFFAPLVLWLLVKRQWRAAAVSLATGAGLFALGVAVFGWREHIAWLGVLRDVRWDWLPMNSSIFAPLDRAAHFLTEDSPSAPLAVEAFRDGALIAAPCFCFAMWLAGRDRNIDRAFLLILLTSIFTAPVGWIYYWWVFVPPLAACWCERAIRRAFWVSLPGWLANPWFIWPASSIPLLLTTGSLYFWSLAAIWLGSVASSAIDGQGGPVDASRVTDAEPVTVR